MVEGRNFGSGGASEGNMGLCWEIEFAFVLLRISTFFALVLLQNYRTFAPVLLQKPN